MLDKKTILEEDAIEKHFCSMLDGKANTEMDEESTEMMMRIMLSPKVKLVTEGKEFKKYPDLIQMMIGRSQALDFRFTDLGPVVFLGFFAETPGVIVMYLTMIQFYCKKKNIKEVGLEELCTIFPFGFYSNHDLEKAWEAQKVKGAFPDNLLDYNNPLKSLRF